MRFLRRAYRRLVIKRFIMKFRIKSIHKNWSPDVALTRHGLGRFMGHLESSPRAPSRLCRLMGTGR